MNAQVNAEGLLTRLEEWLVIPALCFQGEGHEY